jgi:hypothetical protein
MRENHVDTWYAKEVMGGSVEVNAISAECTKDKGEFKYVLSNQKKFIRGSKVAGIFGFLDKVLGIETDAGRSSSAEDRQIKNCRGEYGPNTYTTYLGAINDKRLSKCVIAPFEGDGKYYFMCGRLKVRSSDEILSPDNIEIQASNGSWHLTRRVNYSLMREEYDKPTCQALPQGGIGCRGEQRTYYPRINLVEYEEIVFTGIVVRESGCIVPGTPRF